MQSVSLGGNPRDASFERTLDIIEVIADAAYRRLPHKFRALCEDLVISVEDFPSDEVLDQLGAQTAVGIASANDPVHALAVRLV